MVKWKLISLFSVIITFLLLRLLLYLDMKFTAVVFDEYSIYNVIPFYTTEIVITITISYILFSVSRIDNSA
jgi:hypothetical protein